MTTPPSAGSERGQPSAPADSLADQLIDAEVDLVPPPAAAPARRRGATALLVVGLALVAFNLRPALSSLGPVLPEVMRDTGLSAAGAGWLSTLPVVCLGVFAPLAPMMARRIGAERTILLVMVAIALGNAVRIVPTVPALYLSAIVAGAAIAIGNVLMPGLVKRDFPTQAPLMTGLYTMALCLGGAAAAGATVPLEGAAPGGWPAALAFWGVPAVLGAMLWLPQLAGRAQDAAGHVAYQVRGLWRCPLAWQVTFFMGLQSALAYSVFAWLAPILQDRGLSAVEAGLAVSVSIVVQVVAALIAPPLAARSRDQRLAVVACAVATQIGFLGCVFAPLGSVWVWALLLGAGQGSLFSLAIMFIVLRSPDAHVAAHLSGMSQSVGYCLAAFGPLFFGLTNEWTGGWAAAAALFFAIGVVDALFGFGAGRNRHVDTETLPVASAAPAQ